MKHKCHQNDVLRKCVHTTLRQFTKTDIVEAYTKFLKLQSQRKELDRCLSKTPLLNSAVKKRICE